MSLGREALLCIAVVSIVGSANAGDGEACRERYDQSVGTCALEAQKTAPDGDYSYYTKCGARFEPEYQRCLAEGNSSGASQPGSPPVGCSAAKENIDWIFRDSGARNTFLANRSEGKDAFSSAIAAQAHNPAAQRTLMECQSWATDYVNGLDPSRGPAMPDRTLGQRDCECITIVPLGGFRYRVSNSCDEMRMMVRFADAANSTRHAWADAGIVSGGGQSTVSAPAYEIVSISGANLKNSTSSVTCVY